MPHRQLPPLLWFVRVLLIAFIVINHLGLLAVCWLLSYEQFVELLLSFYGKTELLEAVQAKWLTFEKFQVVRWFALLSLAISFSVIRQWLWTQATFQQLFKPLEAFFEHTVWLWQQLDKSQKRGFCITIGCILAYRLGVAFYFPVLIDEAFSFVYFVKQGPLVTAAYYPGPNNHIFYNLIAAAAYKIIPHPEVAMRLVSGFFGLMTLGLLGVWLLRKVGYWATMVAIWVLAFLPYELIYSVQGRGYSLQVFLFLWGWISFQHYYASYTPYYWRQSWIAAMVLSLYTLPTSLYFVLSLGVWASFSVSRPKLLLFFKDAVWVVMLSFMLYFPVFLISGWRTVVQNDWVVRLPWGVWLSKFPLYFVNVWNDLLIDNIGILFPLLGFTMVGWLLNYKKVRLQHSRLMVQAIFLIVFPWVLLWVQGVLPPARIWTYLSVPAVVLLACVLRYTLQPPYRLRAVFLVGLLIALTTTVWIQAIRYHDEVPQRFAASIAKSGKFQQIYANEDHYRVMLAYEFARRNQPLAMATAFAPSSVKRYDLVVLSKSQPLPHHWPIDQYTLFWENKQIQAYTPPRKPTRFVFYHPQKDFSFALLFPQLTLL